MTVPSNVACLKSLTIHRSKKLKKKEENDPNLSYWIKVNALKFGYCEIINGGQDN